MDDIKQYSIECGVSDSLSVYRVPSIAGATWCIQYEDTYLPWRTLTCEVLCRQQLKFYTVNLLISREILP